MLEKPLTELCTNLHTSAMSRYCERVAEGKAAAVEKEEEDEVEKEEGEDDTRERKKRRKTGC